MSSSEWMQFSSSACMLAMLCLQCSACMLAMLKGKVFIVITSSGLLNVAPAVFRSVGNLKIENYSSLFTTQITKNLVQISWFCLNIVYLGDLSNGRGDDVK